MSAHPICFGTIAERDAEHEESLRRAKRCGPHPGRCPDCPEGICWLCNGSGQCRVAAVDARGDGILAIDDRDIYMPCVACKSDAGGKAIWRAESSTRIRLYGPNGELKYAQEIAAGTSLDAQPAEPFTLTRLELLA